MCNETTYFTLTYASWDSAFLLTGSRWSSLTYFSQETLGMIHKHAFNILLSNEVGLLTILTSAMVLQFCASPFSSSYDDHETRPPILESHYVHTGTPLLKMAPSKDFYTRL